jgi:putative ABC transport system permease protein
MSLRRHRFLRRLIAFFTWNARDDEMNREMAFHIESMAREYVRSGMDAAEAERAARRRFGNVLRLKEQGHDVRSAPLVEDVVRDVRHVWRGLRRSPSFTIAVVLTMALGIGANTAMFSVVNAVILRPLPFQDPDRLAMLWTNDPKREIREEGTSYPTLLDWRSQSRTFADMAICSRGNPVTLTGGNDPERVMGEAVSANLFPLLGVTPILGRSFSHDEEQRRERVVVLSYALWQRRFGASRDAIEKTLEIDGERFQVIGVMPAGFYFPTKDVQLWQPATFVGLTLAPAVRDRIWTSRFSDWWRVVGRLRPDATFDDAQAEMTAIGQRLALVYRTADPGFAGFGVNVVPLLLQATGRELQRALWILLGAVGFVLLIACSNVANLLLARGAARQREFALRAALGAGQMRLIRQLAVESALLVVGGGVVGLALAIIGVRTLEAAAPPGIPRLDEMQLDARVLIFTGSVSILGGLLFAIVPAWKTSRSDPADALKQGGRTGSEGLSLSRTRRTFVVVECALAVALLAGAGLLLKSFMQVETINPGFEGKQVLLARITSARLSQEMFDRIANMPGVLAVGAIQSFEPRNPDQPITAEGQPSLKVPLTFERVTAGFFRAMGVPLRRGRLLTEQDSPGSVALINETMAKTFWPLEDPVGKRFKRGTSASTSRWMTVVGVVGDMRRRGLERDAVSEFYFPEIESSMELVIRTTTDPLGYVPSIRQVIRSVDRNAVVGRVTTVQNHIEQLGAARRFHTWLIAIFAGLALGLSAIGMYGLMHYSVAQRTHEMGIRIALGARGSDVSWLVIGEGLRLVLFGVAVGLLAALQLTGVMAQLLFEVSPTDPATFAIVPVVLAMVAVLACYLPARRASKVDPVVALRYE